MREMQINMKCPFPPIKVVNICKAVPSVGKHLGKLVAVQGNKLLVACKQYNAFGRHPFVSIHHNFNVQTLCPANYHP